MTGWFKEFLRGACSFCKISAPGRSIEEVWAFYPPHRIPPSVVVEHQARAPLGLARPWLGPAFGLTCQQVDGSSTFVAPAAYLWFSTVLPNLRGADRPLLMEQVE